MQYMILVSSVKIFFIRPRKSTRLLLRMSIIQNFPGEGMPTPRDFENFVALNISELAKALVFGKKQFLYWLGNTKDLRLSILCV